MIEYIYDAIRATAGNDVIIAAEVTEENGDIVTDNCALTLYIENKVLDFDGVRKDGTYEFTIPASITSGLMGRYWYAIKRNSNLISFKQPIYFV